MRWITDFQNDECDGMILPVRKRDMRANDSELPGDLGGAAMKLKLWRAFG